MDIKTGELAALLGVTTKTVAEYRKAGMPQKKYGVFDLVSAFGWWKNNIMQEAGADTQDSKRRYWQAKARREEMQADLESGDLVSFDETKKEISMAIRAVRDGILQVPYRVAALVAVESDPQVVRKILTTEFRQALFDLSKIDYQEVLKNDV